MNTTPFDGPDEGPLDPAEALALAERQQRVVGLSYVKPVFWLYLIWGFAWLTGFLGLWLGYVIDWLPLWVAGVIFGALIIVSIVVSALVGMRLGRGVTGPSNFGATIYGMSWSAFGIAFAILGIGLMSNGMNSELASLYFPSIYALMAGVMYVMGAALWQERSQLALGILLLVVGSAAPFFGAPTNNLVMAIGGGGGFLVAAAHFGLQLKKVR